MTITIGISFWFFLCLVVHLCALRSYDTKRTTETMIYLMYFPSRMTFMVWGPWLGGLVGDNLTTINDGLDNISNFDKIN